MADAILGAVIMVVATTSLVFAIEAAEKSFNQAGRYPLSDKERLMLTSVGLRGDQLEKFWSDSVLAAPRELENAD